VTLYARSTHLQGPSGVSYWNPDGNVFVWYGKTVGVPGGVDINRTGPALSTSSPVFDSVTFGPGDVWVGGDQLQPLYVHFAGTNRFRTYGTPSRVEPSTTRTWGVKVDENTGNVFVVLPLDGMIVRLNPLTAEPGAFAEFTEWFFGGLGAGPAGITLDGQGRPFVTVSGLDLVARLDSGVDGVQGTDDDFATYWPVPNRDGIRSFRTVPPLVPVVGEEYPNAIITTDGNGNIWFTQSNSNEIGRLSAGPDGVLGSPDDVICEYTKPGLANPQQIVSTGSGNLLQIYFTEGEGNSVSVLTQAEADMAGAPTQVCTTVPAQTQVLGPVFRGRAPFFDEEIQPQQTTIVPTVHHVQGLDGAASGTTTTADGQPIPPILRFSPMPNPLLSGGTPLGDAGNGFPSGLTGVYADNRIAGAYLRLRGNKHFELRSGAVIAPPPSAP
jgi:hypothetical protein